MNKKLLFLVGLLLSAGAYAADTGMVTTSAPSYTPNTPAAFSLDVNGNLRVITANTNSTTAQGLQGTITQSWFVENTDGSNVIGTSSHPFYDTIMGSLPAGNNTIGYIANPNFGISGTLPAFAVTPTFIIGAGTAAIGSVVATQATGSNLHVVVDSGAITSSPSGTQNVNESQINGVAVTTGSGTATGAQRIVVGTDTATIAGSPPSTILTVTQSTQPLPTGASTATNQTIVQSTPGTSAATALTIQGSASGVPVPVTTIPAQGSSTMITTQVSVTTSSTLISAAATGYVFRGIRNDPLNTSAIVFGSSSSITTTTGYKLNPGDSFDLSRMPGAVYGISVTGTSVVDYIQY